MSDEGEIGASPRAAAGVLPCSRLEASRVSKGDKVILLAGERREDIDGKWGIVKQVIERRLAVVTCKASNKGLYPPSYTETEIVVPLSCAFDLNDASARSEFICQCINRSLNLHGLLSSKFGVSGDMMEIYLHIAKHLVRYCQSLLVFSGYRQKIYSSVFCRHWDKRKNYWVSAAKLPSPRIDCAVMSPHSGLIVCAGGIDDHPSVGTPLETVVSFDTLTDEWTKLPSMNIRRHGCCGAFCDGRLYVFGGAYAEVASSTTILEAAQNGLPFFEHLDVRSKEAKWVPGSRKHLSMESTDRLFASCGKIANGKIVLAGGEVPRANSSVRQRYSFEYRLDTVFEAVNTCLAYDPVKNCFDPVAAMNDARIGAAYCVYEGCLVVAGGQNQRRETLKSVEKYDGSTDRWEQLADLNQARFHASMTVWNGRLTIVGGSYEENQYAFNSGKVSFTDKVEQYDSGKNSWTVCKNLRMPVAFHACFAASINMKALVK